MNPQDTPRRPSRGLLPHFTAFGNERHFGYAWRLSVYIAALNNAVFLTGEIDSFWAMSSHVGLTMTVTEAREFRRSWGPQGNTGEILQP